MKRFFCLLLVAVILAAENNCVAAGETTFPASGVPVLMYHSISTEPGNTLCVPETQFSEEMALLHAQGYQTINMDTFYESMSRPELLPEKPVLITFDDGYADNFQTAWPILKQQGFTATFFIVTDYVGPDRISWEQLRELVDNGNSIGSHSVCHVDLATLGYAAQEDELRRSKELLESQLGIGIKTFCYPFGKYNETTLSLLKGLGYQLGFTTVLGKVCQEDEPLLLKRVRVWGGMPLSEFQEQL